MKRRFCAVPFLDANIKNDGGIELCCADWMHDGASNAGNILSEPDLMKIWNSPRAQALRREILDGSFKSCNADVCPVIAQLPTTDQIDDPYLADIIANESTVLDRISKLAFNFDASCNLACPQCRGDVIVVAGDSLAEKRRIYESILATTPKVDTIMLTGSGDPFVSPVFRDFLFHFDRERFGATRLILFTNGLLLTPQNWKKLEASGAAERVASIRISIDAACEETYAIVRRGPRESSVSNFARLKDNLAFLAELKREGKIESLTTNFVIQRRNFTEMGDFVDFSLGYAVDNVVFTTLYRRGEMREDRHYDEHAVHVPSHPLHRSFLDRLDDGRLDTASVFLPGQVSDLRTGGSPTPRARSLPR